MGSWREAQVILQQVHATAFAVGTSWCLILNTRESETMKPFPSRQAALKIPLGIENKPYHVAGERQSGRTKIRLGFEPWLYLFLPMRLGAGLLVSAVKWA